MKAKSRERDVDPPVVGKPKSLKRVPRRHRGAAEALNKRYKHLLAEYNSVLQERDAARIALASATQSYQSFVQLNEQQNQIAVFLRLNYQAEISSGAHGGMTLAQVVIRYLGRERRIGRWRRRLIAWLSGRQISMGSENETTNHHSQTT